MLTMRSSHSICKRSLTFAKVPPSVIRGGSSSRRVARLLACASVAVLVAAPASAGAQSAIDEYTLDIPGAGSAGSGGDPTAPSGGASGTAGGGRSGLSAPAARQQRQLESRGLTGEQAQLQFAPFHTGGPGLDTNSRSAPEVVADSLLDGAMLPILAGLALITGVGAWRVFRGRWTPTGGAGSPTGGTG
jgi:hypothetical protein